jgi:exosome complex component RRP42
LKASPLLDDMSSDWSIMLSSALSASLTPSPQLSIIPQEKAWLLNIDVLVLADRGNIFDAIMIAIRGALWDLRIPRTRAVEFEAREGAKDDNGNPSDEIKSLLRKKKIISGDADFSLEDHGDEGEYLKNLEALPIGMTLNLVSKPHYLLFQGF